MAPLFRQSKYLDFNSGIVFLDPMAFKKMLPRKLSLPEKMDLFECRTEVWQLGVAAGMLKLIENSENHSIWAHAAFGVISVVFSYFEMIGKTLNSGSETKKTSSEDFNWGFCDVYPDFKPSNGVYSDKIQVGGRRLEINPDPLIQKVGGFRNRIRNGVYHLGMTKKGLWIHNDKNVPDFCVDEIPNPSGNGLIDIYRMNPHGTTRTIIDHFANFMVDLRNQERGLQPKFEKVFDTFYNVN